MLKPRTESMSLMCSIIRQTVYLTTNNYIRVGFPFFITKVILHAHVFDVTQWYS